MPVSHFIWCNCYFWVGWVCGLRCAKGPSSSRTTTAPAPPNQIDDDCYNNSLNLLLSRWMWCSRSVGWWLGWTQATPTFYNSRRRRDFMTVPGLAAPEKNDENYKVAAAAPPATTAGGWPIWFSEQEVNQVGDCSVYLYFCGAFRPTNNICENSLRRADWKKLPQQTKGEQFCCSSS